MDKIIVVDKPTGKTSHDLVQEYRKKLGTSKVGHAGTLDPFATGVLILLVGKATKRFEEFLSMDKEYEMTVELGWSTDTLDPSGQVISQDSNKQINKLQINENTIKRVLKGLIGKHRQEVPKYSALKIRGKPLYWYAREGKKAGKIPRCLEYNTSQVVKKQVEIKKIKLRWFSSSLNSRSYGYPRMKIRVVCSSGTYMRRLAYDIGKKLGVPAVAVELRRIRIGEFCIVK